MFKIALLLFIAILRIELGAEAPLQPTQLYLVRHGETYRNKMGDRISGQENGKAAQLTETGRKQADQLGKKLAERYPDEIHVIYTSTLDRAKETAKLIALHFPHAMMIEDPRLMEFRHGKYDTMNFKMRNQICLAKYVAIEKEAAQKGEMLDRFFKWKLRLSDLIDYDPTMTATVLEGEPESALEVFNRVSAALEEIAHNHPGQKVLIVTHGGVIKTVGFEAESRQRGDTGPLPIYFEQVPGTSILTENCSLNHFEKVSKNPLTFIRSENLN